MQLHLKEQRDQSRPNPRDHVRTAIAYRTRMHRNPSLRASPRLTLALVQTLGGDEDDTQPFERVVVAVNSSAEGDAPPPDTMPSAESAIVKLDPTKPR